MHNQDTELVFPLRVLPMLRSFRGEKWRQIIDKVISGDANIIEETAISMVMMDVTGCLTCNSDSFRALKGCTKCAEHALRKSKCSDQDLLERFKTAKERVKVFLKKNHPEMIDVI
ncbi:MAG TPA: hypothetical protein G4N92_09115 [Anaerolineae bacterium]|nr:hypothetical protein [Anaerolineae bacterium]